MATNETAQLLPLPGTPQQPHVSLLTTLCGREELSITASAADTTATTTRTSGNHTSGPLHVLVQGPNHSGRSSLAMDIAMEMASNNSTCQCHPTTSTTTTTNATGSRICHCQPVALLRFDPKSIRRFPLACHRRQHATSTSTTTISTWTRQSLQRIQVHHVVTLRSCLKFLLALQGKPHHQQPFGAIILDDIDHLHDNPCSNSHANPCMVLSQVLALVMDTINYLHRPPAVVCLTMNNNNNHKNLAKLFSATSLAASFLHGIVTLQASTSNASSHTNKRSPWNRIGHGLLCSSWIATWVPRGLHDAKNCVEYHVVSNDAGRCRILWEERQQMLIFTTSPAS